MKVRKMLTIYMLLACVVIVSFAVWGFFLLKQNERELPIRQEVEALSRSNKSLQKHINYLVELTGEDTERLHMIKVVSKIIADYNKDFNYEESLSVAEQIYENWKLYNIEPSIQLAVIKVESSFDPNAVGKIGEQGLFQVLPSTGAIIFDAIDLGEYHDSKLINPTINTRVAGYYLHKMKRRFWPHSKTGNVYHLVLSSYNRGSRPIYEMLSEGKVPKTSYSEKVIKEAAKISDKYSII